MTSKNIEIAQIFNKLADLLELENENTFRVRAYRNAALTMENLTKDIEQMVENGEDLTQLPAIGPDLEKKIIDIVNNKEIELLKNLEGRNPIDFTQLSRVQGLGAKRIKKLYEALGIKNIDELEQAAKAQNIRHLDGFNEKLEQQILEETKKIKEKYNRFKISTAEQYALPLVEYLKNVTDIEKIEIAGSYRRKQETIGDIDILVTCDKCDNVMDKFIHYPQVERVLTKGVTRSSVVLKSGIQIDLRAVPQKSYGAALHYFTGSKAHNINIRKLAKQHGWKINEYGLFDGEKFLAGKTEKDIYKKLGLPYIEPELRTNGEEFEAALQNRLPDLIQLKDIKGDLHMHTTRTDGRNSLEEMAQAAQALGYDYIANTEHSQRLAMAHGLNTEQLEENIKRIEKLNETLENFTILKGIEVDILEDGTLDLPDSILKKLDIVIGAVHYKFNLSKQDQTERIMRAMDNKYFNILAHPTGRLINEREPYDVDMERIMRHAKENNCFLEINSQPSRLDLNDIYIKMGKEIGIKFSIDTDAHSTADYSFMRYGVAQARRGWLEANDVINTRNLKDLKILIKRK